MVALNAWIGMKMIMNAKTKQTMVTLNTKLNNGSKCQNEDATLSAKRNNVVVLNVNNE